MKKIKQLSFVLFIFSVLAFSYLVTSVSAQMGSPDMGAPGIGAPSMGAPGTVCIPESAQDQARKLGFKCMTPETIEIITTRGQQIAEKALLKGMDNLEPGRMTRERKT